MKRIAIVGASGHVGRSLAAELAARGDVRLDLYARRPGVTLAQMRDGLARGAPRLVVDHCSTDALDLAGCDVVVNAIGVASPADVAAKGHAIIGLTLEWEERLRHALRACPEALYVAISSGAAYGALADGPACADSRAVFTANGIPAREAYGRAKLMAETMHRGWAHRRVLDIRLFGYVSAMISLEDTYFLSELYRALVRGTPFTTSGDDMVRDYVGPRELLALIDCAFAAGPLNAAVDMVSARPARKFEILSAMAALGLVTHVSTAPSIAPARSHYYSTCDHAARLGFVPRRSACDVALDTAREVLAAHREIAA